MKRVLMTALGLAVSILALKANASPNFNDGDWHQILTCDSGAVEIDNKLNPSRGVVASAAQIVIHDQNIIRYFAQAGGIIAQRNSALSEAVDTSGAPGNTLSFSLDSSLAQGEVAYNGRGLDVVLQTSSSAPQVNWHFNNCEQAQ